MDDIKLTETQLDLLRSALGLSFYVTTPTRNWLPSEDIIKHATDVDELKQIGFLATKTFFGAGGKSFATTITDAGKEYVFKRMKDDADI